jgi:hypothetical protein
MLISTRADRESPVAASIPYRLTHSPISDVPARFVLSSAGAVVYINSLSRVEAQTSS